MSIRDNLDISAYLVLGPENTLGRPVGDVVAQALDAGFTCIQVRSKVASAREIIALTDDAAQAIARAGKTGQVALLIDDRLDCVLAAREQGVAVDGVTVAQSMGFDPAAVFKTLVARGAKGQFYVFDVPVAENLDLKKAAKAVGEKSIEMLHQKELLPLTGYVHGGCSPVGMKKQFPTVFHETALGYDTICVSAGKIGAQVECDPQALIALLRAKTADVIV